METNRIAVYAFDADTKLFSDFRYESADYRLLPNETTVAPADGTRPPYSWNGSSWDGASKEEFEKEFSGFKAPLTPSTQAINLLGQQLVEAEKEGATSDNELNDKVDKLTKSLNLLGQMVAKHDKPKEEANNG